MTRFKYLFIFSLFLLILFLFNTKVFATIDFTYNNVEYKVPNFPSSMNFEHKLITTANVNGWLTCYSSTSPFYIVKSGTKVYVKTDAERKWAYNYYRTSKNWSAIETSPAGSLQLISSDIGFMYCTEPLYYVDNQGNRTDYYTPPESYSNLPIILNDSESISIGGQSIVIMPGDFPNTKEIRFTIQEKTVDGDIVTYHNLFAPLSLTNSSDYYVSPPRW